MTPQGPTVATLLADLRETAERDEREKFARLLAEAGGK